MLFDVICCVFFFFFIVIHLLLRVDCYMHGVYSVMCSTWRVVLVVCDFGRGVYGWLFVVCCMLYVICCMWCGMCNMVCVVWWRTFGVCDALLVVLCVVYDV